MQQEMIGWKKCTSLFAQSCCFYSNTTDSVWVQLIRASLLGSKTHIMSQMLIASRTSTVIWIMLFMRVRQPCDWLFLGIKYPWDAAVAWNTQSSERMFVFWSTRCKSIKWINCYEAWMKFCLGGKEFASKFICCECMEDEHWEPHYPK